MNHASSEMSSLTRRWIPNTILVSHSESWRNFKKNLAEYGLKKIFFCFSLFSVDQPNAEIDGVEENYVAEEREQQQLAIDGKIISLSIPQPFLFKNKLWFIF